MNATETSTDQYFLFEHPFNVSILTLLGFGCLGLLLWTLYRERWVLGAKATTLFVALRIIAIGTAFWMLLAPTNVVEQSSTTRKAVVIVSDTSASMLTIDPAGTADDLRWAAYSSDTLHDDPFQQPIALTDRSIAALGIAKRELAGAIDNLQQHGSESRMIRHLQLANKAVDRVRTHFDRLRDLYPEVQRKASATSMESQLNRLGDLLLSPELDSFSDIAAMLQRGHTPKELGWREGLPDLINRITAASRVFRELGSQLHRLQKTHRADVPSIPRSYANKTRSERVADFLDRFQKSQGDAIGETADLRWCLFDQAARDFTNPADAIRTLTTLADRDDSVQHTDLTSALQHVDQMRRNQPVAATFVLSDVGHNQTESAGPADIASQLDETPIYVVPIGNDQRLRDIDLVSVSAPSVAMRNDDVVIEAHLEVYQCQGESFTVELLRDGQVVDFRNITIDLEAQTQRVQFAERVAEIGSASFQIAVQPLDGEMTTENNFDAFEINVTRSDIKVLIADELPRWEYRYLTQLFRRDPKVELDELLFRPRLIATGNRGDTKTFPVNVDQWDHYDVVILGDVLVEHFPVAAQESLVEYMQTRGGTLIMIAGRNAMPHAYVDHPIADVLPVHPIANPAGSPSNEYAFQVTEAGKLHAALMIGETAETTRSAWEFVNNFSPLNDVSAWRTPLPTAQSLIAVVPSKTNFAANSPEVASSSFLCWQPVGRGRIIYLSGPETYRLRFLRGDSLHYRFWGQLMRWAIASDLSSGTQSVRVRIGKTLYRTDQSVDVEVELANADGTPVVHDDPPTDQMQLRLTTGEESRTVPIVAIPDRPGHYRADIRGLEPGVYQVQPSGSLIESLLASDDQTKSDTTDKAIASFTVQAELPRERVDTRCNRVLANQVSKITGGQILPPTAVEEILQLTDLDPVITHTAHREPLWVRWKYLWIVFGCLQTEWIIRKWRGLS